MDRAEPRARRQYDRAQGQLFLQRISGLVAVDNVKSVCIRLPDERMAVARRGSQVSMFKHGVLHTGTEEEVLTALVPVIRRAMEQQLNVRVVAEAPFDLATYSSPSFALDPQFSYLADLSPRPATRDACFVERLRLLLDCMNDDDSYMVNIRPRNIVVSREFGGFRCDLLEDASLQTVLEFLAARFNDATAVTLNYERSLMRFTMIYAVADFPAPLFDMVTRRECL